MDNINLPEAFVQRLRASYPDADEMIAAIATPPFLSVRLNPRKPFDSSVLPLADNVAWNDTDGRYLSARPNFTLMPHFHAGAFYVQEASSMFLSHVLASIMNNLPSTPVCLDLCAAPGGKSTLLLSRLSTSGVVVANEVVRSRAWILRENVAKWGHPGAIVTNRTPAEIASSGARFDVVAVDAPCSGEGMFRKDDVAVTEWSPKAAADCAVRQRSILSDIWPALRTGGYLIYSTCTFNPAENEDNMQWAVEQLGAEVVNVDIPEGWGITRRIFNAGQGYAFLPHKVRGEGFFMCLLRKVDATTSSVSSGKRRRAPAADVKPSNLGADFVDDSMRCFALADDVFAFPADRARLMQELTVLLSPIMSGISVGVQVKKKNTVSLNPAPELALSSSLMPGRFGAVDVDSHVALKFLHGDTDLPLTDLSDAWTLISHAGLHLGFVKPVGNRLNNYYPKEWRIRMSVQ